MPFDVTLTPTPSAVGITDSQRYYWSVDGGPEQKADALGPYVIPGLGLDQTVSYQCDFRNTSGGVSDRTAPQQISTPDGIPDNFVGSPGNAKAILNWEDPPITISEIQIFRDGQQIATVEPVVQSYVDEGLTNEQEYTYEIRSVGIHGTSDFSGEVSVTPTEVALLTRYALFDETLVYSRIGTTSPLESTTGSFAYMARVRMDQSTVTWSVFGGRTSSTDRGWQLGRRNADETLEFIVYQDAGSTTPSSIAALDLSGDDISGWVTCIGMWNDDLKRAEVYALGKSAFGDVIASRNISSTEFQIGSSQGNATTSQNFNGAMKGSGIVNRLLTPQEITDLQNAQHVSYADLPVAFDHAWDMQDRWSRERAPVLGGVTLDFETTTSGTLRDGVISSGDTAGEVETVSHIFDTDTLYLAWSDAMEADEYSVRTRINGGSWTTVQNRMSHREISCSAGDVVDYEITPKNTNALATLFTADGPVKSGSITCVQKTRLPLAANISVYSSPDGWGAVRGVTGDPGEGRLEGTWATTPEGVGITDMQYRLSNQGGQGIISDVATGVDWNDGTDIWAAFLIDRDSASNAESIISTGYNASGNPGCSLEFSGGNDALRLSWNNGTSGGAINTATGFGTGLKSGVVQLEPATGRVTVWRDRFRRYQADGQYTNMDQAVASNSFMMGNRRGASGTSYAYRGKIRVIAGKGLLTVDDVWLLDNYLRTMPFHQLYTMEDYDPVDFMRFSVLDTTARIKVACRDLIGQQIGATLYRQESEDTSPVSPVTVDANGFATFDLTGLIPGERYQFRPDGSTKRCILRPDVIPDLPTFIIWGCNNNNHVGNSTTTNPTGSQHIVTQYQNNPGAIVVVNGDENYSDPTGLTIPDFYADWKAVPNPTIALYNARRFLWEEVPQHITLIDNHDFSGITQASGQPDGNVANAATSLVWHRASTPSIATFGKGSGAVYNSQVFGRVRVIALDTMGESVHDGDLVQADQLAWVAAQADLVKANNEICLFVTPRCFDAHPTKSWARAPGNRAALFNSMVKLSGHYLAPGGDEHRKAADDGANQGGYDNTGLVYGVHWVAMPSAHGSVVGNYGTWNLIPNVGQGGSISLASFTDIGGGTVECRLRIRTASAVTDDINFNITYA